MPEAARTGQQLRTARRGARWAFAPFALTCLIALAAHGRSHAQSRALEPRGFNIDLVTGPIVGPNSTIALGGAYTSLGFGVDAAALTPAAYAARTLFDLRWFDLDLTAGYSPGALRNTDFDNNGEAGFSYRDYYALSGGLRFGFGEFGLGGLLRYQNYRVGTRANLGVLTANYGAGYAFVGGQLLLAAAARSVLLDFDSATTGRNLAQFDGTGPEFGAVLALADRPFRLGIAARAQVEAGESDQLGTAAGFMLPRALVLPAELQLGFAYQFGPRPLNRRWVNPHDIALRLRDAMLARRLARARAQVEHERSEARLRQSLDSGPPLEAIGPEPEEPLDREYSLLERTRAELEDLELARASEAAEREHFASVRALSRRYLLLAIDALLIAPIDDGIGLESFLSQRRETSGRRLTFGVRFGAESEPIENRLKLRAGSYLEPSRFAAGSPRVHATLGTDIRLFAWDLFGLMNPVELRIGGAIDVAVRYLNYGISFGVWN